MILNQGFQNSYFIWFSYSGVPLNSANLPVVQHHLVYIVSSSVMSALLASASISLSPSLIFKRPSPEGEGGGRGVTINKSNDKSCNHLPCIALLRETIMRLWFRKAHAMPSRVLPQEPGNGRFLQFSSSWRTLGYETRQLAHLLPWSYLSRQILCNLIALPI